jgi:hypothetical protein
LDLLRESIQKEVKKSSKTEKGDFRPIVFILTDGQPTDDWRKALARLKKVQPALASLYAFGCGDEVDFETLALIADVCFQVESLSTETLTKLFVWVTASVQKSVLSQGDLELSKSGPLAEGMRLIDSDRPPKFEKKNSRLYFHARCAKTRQDYLIKYRLAPHGDIYVAEKSEPLGPDFFADGAAPAPAVASSRLSSAACPHCENQSWARCPCGRLFCVDPNTRLEVVCPYCGNKAILDRELIFEVDGSVG